MFSIMIIAPFCCAEAVLRRSAFHCDKTGGVNSVPERAALGAFGRRLATGAHGG
jgi:hypothetical protein